VGGWLGYLSAGWPQVRKWAEEKILQGQGKVKEFFKSGKKDI